MKKILVLGTSLSSHSINYQLAQFAAKQLKQTYELIYQPLSDIATVTYNIDIEKTEGFPPVLTNWVANLKDIDGIILSTSEHNANITAAFKNLIDWASRINKDFLKDIKLLLLSTSPGGYGGQNARNNAEIMLPKFGGIIESKFSLPKFNEHFQNNEIISSEYLDQLNEAISIFEQNLNH